MMAQYRLESLIFCSVLYSVMIIKIHGQFNFGAGYLPYGSPHQQGREAMGPHIAGMPQPGNGAGNYPQYPPPERPAYRPANRPRPPVVRPPVVRPPVVRPPIVRPVVTPQPIAPPTQRIIPAVPANPPTERIIPVIPANPPTERIIPAVAPTAVAGVPPREPTEKTKVYVPIFSRRPLWPSHPRFTEPPDVPTCTMREQNPCSNRGICYTDPFTGKPLCQCRDLYAGDKCELVLKPPKNITVADIASTYVSIRWMPPPVERTKLNGFIVQYNKFGDQRTWFSPNIHPGVKEYTLRDLEPESQYTICINIIFKNITAREAILRDQCLEIRTQPDEFDDGGISLTFMALIIGGVVLILLFIMVIALVIQRRCLKPINVNYREPIRTIQRAMSRRSMLLPRHHHKHNVNHHNHLPRQEAREAVATACASRPRDSDQEAEACVKVHRIPPPPSNPRSNHANPFFARLQTNNANNSDYKDWALPVSVNYSRLHVSDQPPRYTRSSSTSIPQTTTNIHTTNRNRTELSTFGHDRKNPDLRSSASVPAHAMIRALPPSVSNHVMRSKNAREKDASKEFDVSLGGNYMYFSGQNLTA